MWGFEKVKAALSLAELVRAHDSLERAFTKAVPQSIVRSVTADVAFGPNPWHPFHSTPTEKRGRGVGSRGGALGPDGPSPGNVVTRQDSPAGLHRALQPPAAFD